MILLVGELDQHVAQADGVCTVENEVGCLVRVEWAQSDLVSHQLFHFGELGFKLVVPIKGGAACTLFSHVWDQQGDLREPHLERSEEATCRLKLLLVAGSGEFCEGGDPAVGGVEEYNVVVLDGLLGNLDASKHHFL